VHSGQILALAIRPTFNPNQFRRTTPALLRNHAVSDVYEPGSTFKLVTYSAALDQHAVTPDSTVDCQGSVITVAGRVIHDDKGDHFGRISITEALEHSSNVGAIKTAMLIGPERFNDYVRAFGFGARSGIELPGETRGLLRPLNRWSGSSIASIAMGQEIAVTPIQLATMVSTIANGGVYLPPHILLPSQPKSSDPNQKSAPLQAAPFRPGEELPNPLPPGAHRVISTLTAAEMRKMLEGVVLYGTGKEAQLNGYSSGGKTGTAQKIDPATHTYSKSMHVASFAGFAPVNNPVIAVAVILDNPKKGYYGAMISAPVFAEVAQQVLEYLGVQHDTELHAVRASAAAMNVHEDEGDQSGADLNALFEATNSLPSDDPLRAPATPAAKSPGPATTQPTHAQTSAATSAGKSATSQNPSKPQSAPPPANDSLTKSVMMQDVKRLRVPTLTGLPVRKVIEQAAAAGLDVQIVGSGSCRQQVPEAGAMVPAGTHVVVRCGH
jgi:cell division protein FtsI (penicillin-binding protein 3)